MFYGKFRDPADKEFLRQAIARFQDMFHRVFAGDNMILFNRVLGYRLDRKFMEVFRAHAHSAQERSLEQRLNTLVWAAKHALHIPGDFVECGVWRGFCSAVLVDYLGFDTVGKRFYLYDTFAGIPEEFDTEKHNSPVMAEPRLYESVCERFSGYPNVIVVRGVVPYSFDQAAPEKIAFLHLDMNSSKSEIAALDVLFERVSPGGVIVFDDFGWMGYQAQHAAEQRFMEQRGYTILEMASGQGLLIKR
jgi:O-methyltransferase